LNLITSKSDEIGHNCALITDVFFVSLSFSGPP